MISCPQNPNEGRVKILCCFRELSVSKFSICIKLDYEYQNFVILRKKLLAST